MARRAIVLVFLAFLLLLWCTMSTFGVLLLYHIVTRLFSRSHVHKLSFALESPTSVHATANIVAVTNRLLRVKLLLTLPESDANLAHSAAPARICVGETCVQSTLPLRFRSPTHRTARALLLAIPLLAGIADEYQRVQIDAIVRSTAENDKLSVILQAPLQISHAQAIIIPKQPPFANYFSKSVLAIILTYWYIALACAIVALRLCSRLQTAFLRRLWPFSSNTEVATSSTACKEESKTVESTDETIPEQSITASRPPLFGKEKTRSSGSLRRRHISIKGALDEEPPACLLNGTYVK